MIFIGFVPYSELELQVKASTGQEIEYYYSIEELIEEEGMDCEVSTIYLKECSVDSLEGYPIYFTDIRMN